MDIFLILLLTVSSITACVLLCIFLTQYYRFNKRSVRIRFVDFLNYYELNPKAWTFENGYLKKRSEKSWETMYVSFGIFGYIAYRIWLVKQRLGEKALERNNDKLKFLSSVQEDINAFNKKKEGKSK